jgi:hypothetical protein
MDPRRSYQTRPDLSARLGMPPALSAEWTKRATGQLRPLEARRPTDEPLLVSSQRGRWRSWLGVVAVVLLLIGLLAFAYVFVHVAFPQ